MSDGPHNLSDPPAFRYSEGDLIQGKYRLAHPIGEGGIGVVWAAHNVVLKVDVAIKLIHRPIGDRETLSRRFLQEARTAAQLAHPAICRVFDYGQTERNTPFIVYELLSGESLGTRLDSRGPMPAIQAIQTVLSIVDGLFVAHALGIVHRDLTSENIFLSEGLAGRIQPKLLDFGIARSMHDPASITLDGAVLGTPNYMSPEQARGDEDIDFRTDIWSLCVVIYELLTRLTPFESENYNSVLWRILNESPKPILEYGAGDAALWQVLEKGLRKNPSERWSSMRELGSALASWLEKHGVSEDTCGASLRATWLDLDINRTSFVGFAPHPRLPSSSRSSPNAESGRGSQKSHRWSDCTLPGVARTSVRRIGAHHLTPLVLGMLGLCLALAATWHLWARAEPGRTEPVEAASNRIDRAGHTRPPLPVVDVEDIAVDPQAAGETDPTGTGTSARPPPQVDAGASARPGSAKVRRRSSASAKGSRPGTVDFGF